jgi:hypothetical protein
MLGTKYKLNHAGSPERNVNLPTTTGNVIPSPAPAIFASPIGENLAYYFHKKNNEKTHGLTPGGSEVLLEKYEGRSHQRLKSKKMKITVSENTTLLNTEAPLYETQKLILMTALKNLKARFFQDINTKNQLGCLSPRHAITSKLKIDECKVKLLACYQRAPDASAFLAEINQSITSGLLCNIYILEHLYSMEPEFSLSHVQQAAYFSEISCIPPVVRKAPLLHGLPMGVDESMIADSIPSATSSESLSSLPDELISPEPHSGTSKKRTSISMFLPRSVVQKKLEKKDQASDLLHQQPKANS